MISLKEVELNLNSNYLGFQEQNMIYFANLLRNFKKIHTLSLNLEENTLNQGDVISLFA